MKLFLDKRYQYGQIRYFPVGVGSSAVAGLTGKKTLTAHDVANLELLGVEVLVAFVEGVALPEAYRFGKDAS